MSSSVVQGVRATRDWPTRDERVPRHDGGERALDAEGRRLQTQHREDLARVGGQVTQFGLDVRDVQQSQQADRKVAQARQRARGVACASAAAVFVIGDIAYVVQLVLDTPMPPVELEQLRRPGLRTRLAADEIDPLEAGGVLADLEDFALDAGHLRGVREVHIAAQSLAGPDAACFHAAMRLVQRDMLSNCGGVSPTMWPKPVPNRICVPFAWWASTTPV